MSSKRETILAQVASALAGTTGVGTRIYRSRVEALSKAKFPAAVVEPLSDSPIRNSLGKLDWTLIFEVMILVRADTMETSADPIVMDAHAKIMGNAGLNSAAIDLLPQATTFKFAEADVPLTVVEMQFAITYRTDQNDLS